MVTNLDDDDSISTFEPKENWMEQKRKKKENEGKLSLLISGFNKNYTFISKETWICKDFCAIVLEGIRSRTRLFQYFHSNQAATTISCP